LEEMGQSMRSHFQQYLDARHTAVAYVDLFKRVDARYGGSAWQ
jgi:hypothetical protein